MTTRKKLIPGEFQRSFLLIFNGINFSENVIESKLSSHYQVMLRNDNSEKNSVYS
jgi:hypothetical protein